MMKKKTRRHSRHRLATAKPLNRGRLFLLAGVAVVAALGLYIGTAYYQVAQDASNRVVEIHSTYGFIPSLTALTQQSTLVIEGTVLDNGTTTLVAQPVGNAQPAAPVPAQGALPGDKGSLIAANHPTTSPPQSAAIPDQSLPVTTYSVRIDQVLHGRATTGGILTLLMLGGAITRSTFPLGPILHRTLAVEGNPLLARTNREVFFLGVNPDGTYHLIGGPQSRFQIAGTTIHVVNPSVPLTKGHDGESEAQFANTIRATP